MTRLSFRPKGYFVCLVLIVMSGCTSWSSSTADHLPGLPTPKMSSDSVVLDIYFVRFPAGDGQFGEKLWEEVDEQFLPMKLQEHLSDNGFSCGLVGAVLPEALDRIMNQARTTTVAGEMKDLGMQSDSQSSSVRRRRQSRTGKRFEIVTSRPKEKISPLVYKDGKVSGEELYRTQCLFSVKTFPLEDGRVRLELNPEIRHGNSRNLITSEVNQGLFIIKTGQDRNTFGHLNLETILSSGQALLLTCSPEFKGLGKEFFIDQSDGVMIQKMILVRLSQTQHSELNTLD